MFSNDNRTLRDFVHRRHILKAYRDCFRLVIKLENHEDRKYMTEWVRSTFHKKLDEKDPITLQMMRTYVTMFTKELTLAIGSLATKK